MINNTDNIEKKNMFKNNLLELAILINKTPTYLEYQRACKIYGWQTNIRYYFPKWNDALEYAGFKTRISQYSDVELLFILNHEAKRLNRTPRQRDFEENDELPSSICYQNHFGSWNNAIKLAGLAINCTSSFTEKELSKILNDFYIEHGRDITYTEAKFTSSTLSFSATTIARRGCGSYAKGIEKLTGRKYIPEPNSFSHIVISEHNHVCDSLLESCIDSYIGHIVMLHEHHVNYRYFLKGVFSNINADIVWYSEVKNKYIVLEIAGMITENQFLGKNKTNDIEKEYLRNLKNKMKILDQNREFVEYIFIFKDYSTSKQVKSIKNVLDSTNNKLDNTLPLQLKIISERKKHYSKNKKHSDSDLLQNLIEVTLKIKQIPYLEDLKTNGYIYPSIYIKRMSWKSWCLLLIDKLNWQVKPEIAKNKKLYSRTIKYTHQELLYNLVNIVIELGRPPTAKEIPLYGLKTSYTTYSNRKSLSKWIEEATNNIDYK